MLEQEPASFDAGHMTSRRKTHELEHFESTRRRSDLAVLGLTGALLIDIRRHRDGRTAPTRSGPVGTWAVQVTLRDCATNAPLGPPFNSLVTFHDGGTLSESAGSLAFAPGQRSPGHGTWTQRAGVPSVSG